MYIYFFQKYIIFHGWFLALRTKDIFDELSWLLLNGCLGFEFTRNFRPPSEFCNKILCARVGNSSKVLKFSSFSLALDLISFSRDSTNKSFEGVSGSKKHNNGLKLINSGKMHLYYLSGKKALIFSLNTYYLWKRKKGHLKT